MPYVQSDAARQYHVTVGTPGAAGKAEINGAKADIDSCMSDIESKAEELDGGPNGRE